MAENIFVGREKELGKLRTLRNRKAPGLVVVKGRRRVGKSRLINFFASTCPENKLWDFAGIVPGNDTDAQSQRDHFAHRLIGHLRCPPFTFQDWNDALANLSMHVKPGDIILLDEISWMGSKDPTFIPKLKDWWDRQQLPIVVVLCGSVSTWVEENILNSTAFFGRVDLTMTLDPLPIPDANKLLLASGFQGSDYDAYRMLSVLGGIPRYLEQVGPGLTVDSMIKSLCFEKDGLLVLEFNQIFHDLFNGKGASYKKILDSLKGGMKTLADVREDIGFPHSGTLSALMEHLIIAGFVQKQNMWSFKTKKDLKQSLYYICDPYMRFYLKVIEPKRNKIDLNGFDDSAVSSMLGFGAHNGLQLEQLLLQNRNILLESIGIKPMDIIASGPFRQARTANKAGCQIDFLVQTTTKTLFVCEFKFKLTELKMEIISEIEEKVKALKVPRGYSVVPVLFHISGVSCNVVESEYFYRIIDIADFLRG